MSRRGGFGRGSRWLVLAAALMCSAAAASAKMLLIPTVSTNDPPIAVKDVVELLFPLRQSACQTKASATAKPDPTELRTLVSCMITERYGAPDSALNNPKSRSQNAVRDQLLALYADTGDVMAPGQPDNMDGGYRGIIKLLPVEPGADLKHLRWVIAALRDYDAFFTQLAEATRTDARTAIDEPNPAFTFRWRALTVRFVRSEKKRTPAAFALPWTVTYNINGSLHRNSDVVRETLFHEIFHMNDFAHKGWSANALRTDYDAILLKCKTAKNRTACFAPYAPGTTKVRGGTYYAFTADNGDSVNEYGAELALRYYVEQHEMLQRGKLSQKAFKCGPA
ncbi:MAG: hypothetical protein KBG15_20965, partial [Kofleriaceae bacterium]|nr:hypothetical protein [Kofleriaceae bacterium]